MQNANIKAAFLLAIAVLLGCQNLHHSKFCQQNLKNIGTAILAYCNTNRHVPPVHYTDDEGSLLHSWRVVLVPYVEANGFYEHYDFNVAWNQGRNAELMDGSLFVSRGKFPRPASVREAYQCSVAPDGHETSYVTVVTSELVPKPRTIGTPVELLGWHQNDTERFLVVELSKSGIHWMEPRDIYMPEIDVRGSIPLAAVRDHIMRSIIVTDQVVFLDRDATLTYLDGLASQP